MEYRAAIQLKDGRTCIIRNGTEADGHSVLDNYILTHTQTDYLLTGPDEVNRTADQEAVYLKAKTDSADEIELLAEVDDVVVGCAGMSRVGTRAKVRHRAEFGISIDKAYWGLGIGRALMEAGIECARRAGYAQLELEVVADNVRAVSLYRAVGFTEYGRNPLGFLSRCSGPQELVLMRLGLKG